MAPEPVRVAVRAMATRFECILPGADQPRLRSIGEAALREVTRAEQRLNFYDPRSELSRLNARAADGPVNVAPDLFELFALAGRMHRSTAGAFDPSVAALMAAWRFTDGSGGASPDDRTLRNVLDDTGYQHVELDPDSRTVRFLRPNLKLDLGGIAKGWALDRVADLFDDHGVTDALVHGGTSSVLARGLGMDNRPWTVGLADPWSDHDEPAWFRRFELVDEVLSVSGVSGKYFEEDGEAVGHVIDPRSGRAVTGRLVAACVGSSAAEMDALSTAMLLLAPDEVPASPPECARFRRDDETWRLEAGRWPGG